jgi:hypothetical protein
VSVRRPTVHEDILLYICLTIRQGAAIHGLRIYHHIDIVPGSSGRLCSQDGPNTLERPLPSMQFYRIQDSPFHMLHQHDAPEPAMPSLFAAAKYAVFKPHGLGWDGADDLLPNDETSCLCSCPSDAQIGSRAHIHPNTRSYETGMLRMNNSPHPIDNGAFDTETATLESSRRERTLWLKVEVSVLPVIMVRPPQKKICSCIRIAFSIKVPPRASRGTVPDGLTAPGGCVGRGALRPMAYPPVPIAMLLYVNMS